MFDFLDGKKTYIMAAVLVLLLVGFLAGLLTLRGFVVAFGISLAVTLVTMRVAIAKVLKALIEKKE